MQHIQMIPIATKEIPELPQEVPQQPDTRPEVNPIPEEKPVIPERPEVTPGKETPTVIPIRKGKHRLIIKIRKATPIAPAFKPWYMKIMLALAKNSREEF